MGAAGGQPLEAEDRFQRGRELGRGSIGVVHVACDLARGGREVALKEAHQSAADGGRILRMERNLLEDLDHPHIVRLEDSFTRNGSTVLVLELMLGENLATYVERSAPLLESQAIRLCVQMLSAVEYLHGLGIVHRDLKAQNLVFAEASCHTLKLLDFGAATMQGDSVLSDIVGTPGYMAPEVAEGRAYDNACDMWSLGAIVFLLLTGCIGADAEHPFLKARSADARSFVRRLLSVNPKDRMGVCSASAHCWLRNSQTLPSPEDSPEICAVPMCRASTPDRRSGGMDSCTAGLQVLSRLGGKACSRSSSRRPSPAFWSPSPPRAEVLPIDQSPPRTLLRSTARRPAMFLEATPEKDSASLPPVALPRGILRSPPPLPSPKMEPVVIESIALKIEGCQRRRSPLKPEPLTITDSSYFGLKQPQRCRVTSSLSTALTATPPVSPTLSTSSSLDVEPVVTDGIGPNMEA